MPYITELARRQEVTQIRVIAPRTAYDDRVAMGWREDEGAQAADGDVSPMEVSIMPKEAEVRRWLREAVEADKVDSSQPVCLFSGISAFPEVAVWFGLSLKFRVRRGLVTEAPYLYDHPLWMHKLRFALKDWRFVPKVDYVFAIGADCADYYRGWSKRWKVVPFMYCTRALNAAMKEWVEEGKPRNDRDAQMCRIAFVGSVDKRKSVGTLIEALARMSLKNAAALNRCKVTIVGDGPEREALQWRCHEAGLANIVRFAGVRPMQETQRLLAAQDVLVLPSLHDGWGAVVNEAMTLGVWPVCSDHCGARQIVQHGKNGYVFKTADVDSLEEILEACVRQMTILHASREERMAWAQQNIGPVAVADIMLHAIKS